MADESQDRERSISVPVPLLASGILIGLAGATYLLLSRGDSEEVAETGRGRGGKRIGRKFGLMTLVTLIENDATRKVVVAALRAIAKRS